MCYIIYKTTNLINNKIYVGQHCSSANDGYLGSGKILKRSIAKYDKENFVRKVLECCTSGDVCEKEIFWIAELSATDKSIGYNIRSGGGFKGKRGVWVDERRKTRSENIKGEKNPNYGNNWSEKQKKKLSDVRKKNGLSKGIKNPKYGKGFKIKGKNNPNSKYIYMFVNPDGIIFDNIDSYQIFSKQYNLKPSSVYASIIYNRLYKGWKITRKLK